MPPGHVFADRYQLLEQLGHGGMSVVWRGFDVVLDRAVAVKVISDTVPAGLRALLRREARAAGRLCHPGIAQVYDFGEATGPDGATEPYLVMELVDGVPLDRWLADGAALPWRRAAAVCGALADALAEVHEHGLVHRDLKPANVLVTGRGPKLVDFGICATVGAADAEDGQLMGTPAYVAPERIADAPVRPASDVYALGVLCYRMIAGTLPWPVDSATGLLRSHLYTEPEELPPLPGLPDELSACVLRALAKEPDERPSARELADVLSGYAETPMQRAVGQLTTALPGLFGAPEGAETAAMAPSGAHTASPDGDSLDTATAAMSPGDPDAPAAPADPPSGATAAMTPDDPDNPAAQLDPSDAPPDRRPAGRQAPQAGRAGARRPGVGVASVAAALLASPDDEADAGPRSRLDRWRGPLVAAGVAGLALAAFSAAWAGGRGEATASPNRPVGTGSICAASYTVRQDWGSGFDAEVTVHNRAGQLAQWSVSFAFPADQAVTAGPGPAEVTTANGQSQPVPVALRQDGATVVADAGAQSLPPGATVVIPVSGRYTHGNPLPTEVSLGGLGCDTQVAGAAVSPAPPTTAAATPPDSKAAPGPGKDDGGPAAKPPPKPKPKGGPKDKH